MHQLPGGWANSAAKHRPELHTWVLCFCKDKYGHCLGDDDIRRTVQSFARGTQQEVIRRAAGEMQLHSEDDIGRIDYLREALVAYFKVKQPAAVEAGYGSE